MRRAARSLLLGSALVLGATSARARLDPERADATIAEARKDGLDGFCKDPPRFLSPRAAAFCDEARDIPDCDGFAARCDLFRNKPEHKEPPSWLASLLGALGSIAHVVVWLLVAAGVGGLIWLLVAAILRAKREAQIAEPLPAATPQGPTEVVEVIETVSDAELLLRRADDHARKGELDRATLLYLAAALRALDTRGALRLSRDRTNGEYVRACKDATAKPELRAIVREVDRVHFGKATPTPDAVADVAARATRLVRAAAVVTAMLALLGGCMPQHGPLARASDPAGDDLLMELLKRQGEKVARLPSSLASLPLPAEDAVAPVVIVDADRVALEDETRAHLVSWVHAGGVLVIAGDPSSWPEELGAKARASDATTVTLVMPLDEDADEDDAIAPRERPIHLAHGAGLTLSDAEELATAAAARVPWAARKGSEHGQVVAMASDDLLTNAGLARPTNAAALVALLAPYEGRTFQVARAEDGIAPPSNPIAALLRAGLGLPLGHALVAGIVLLLAYGVRQARARPTPPPQRRAWTEHLEATGALYARARVAPHALATYARFVDGRLRARMPRGAGDPAAFLALRAKADPQRCAALWQRAVSTRDDEPARGDELAVLRELSALYASAMGTPD